MAHEPSSLHGSRSRARGWAFPADDCGWALSPGPTSVAPASTPTTTLPTPMARGSRSTRAYEEATRRATIARGAIDVSDLIASATNTRGTT